MHIGHDTLLSYRMDIYACLEKPNAIIHSVCAHHGCSIIPSCYLLLISGQASGGLSQQDAALTQPE
jgi:hypothetical protein